MGAIQGLATMGPDSYNEVGSENINLRALITLCSAPHKGKRSYLAQGRMSEFPSRKLLRAGYNEGAESVGLTLASPAG